MRGSRCPWLREDGHLTMDAGYSLGSVVKYHVLGPVSDIDRIHRPLAPIGESGTGRNRGKAQDQPIAVAGLVARGRLARVKGHSLGPSLGQDQPGTGDPALGRDLEP